MEVLDLPLLLWNEIFGSVFYDVEQRSKNTNRHTPAAPAAPICIFGSLSDALTLQTAALRSQKHLFHSRSPSLSPTNVPLYLHSCHTSDLGRATCGEYKLSSEYK